MKIIRFGAIWCPSCISMRPKWREIEKALPWINSTYYEIDENQELVELYRIKKDQIPVAIFLDEGGVETTRLIGEVRKEKIVETIAEILECEKKQKEAQKVRAVFAKPGKKGIFGTIRKYFK